MTKAFNSTLPSKRKNPRRNIGRIQHGRMKAKVGAKATSEQKVFHEWVRAKGCLVTQGPATIHHVTSDGYKRLSRSHWLVVPLRADKHQIIWDSDNSVEALGHAGFTEKYGIDLLAEAKRLKAEWDALSHY